MPGLHFDSDRVLFSDVEVVKRRRNINKRKNKRSVAIRAPTITPIEDTSHKFGVDEPIRVSGCNGDCASAVKWW